MAGGVDQDGNRFHFTVLGFPVHVGWQFFVWPVLAGLDWRTPTQLLEWVAVVFVSVLIHELGHALAYRRFGSPARISLWGLGGLTFGRLPRHRWQDILISLAGPIPPLVLVGLPAYLAYRAGVADQNLFLRQTLLDIWYANLFWSLVNLAPVLPLDGGRVVDKWFGRRTARIVSIVSGTVIAAAFYIVLHNSSLAFLALILVGINAYVFYKERPLDLRGATGFMEAPGGMRIGGPSSSYDEPLAATTPRRGSRKGARRKLKSVPTGPDPRERDGWAALERNEVSKAAAIAKRLKAGASPVLIGALLAKEGKSGAAVAAYSTGILAGAEMPPIGDRILAEAGLAGQVADWITSSDQADRQAILARLFARLQHDEPAAAAEVGEARALHASGPAAGPIWYETACSWSHAGNAERALASLRAAVELDFATADMISLEPSFTSLHELSEFAQILASAR